MGSFHTQKSHPSLGKTKHVLTASWWHYITKPYLSPHFLITLHYCEPLWILPCFSLERTDLPVPVALPLQSMPFLLVMLTPVNPLPHTDTLHALQDCTHYSHAHTRAHTYPRLHNTNCKPEHANCTHSHAYTQARHYSLQACIKHAYNTLTHYTPAHTTRLQTHTLHPRHYTWKVCTHYTHYTLHACTHYTHSPLSNITLISCFQNLTVLLCFALINPWLCV